MVSAAGHTVAIPYRRTDYDKRIQDNILSLLLRKIKETDDSEPLLLKYQRFREVLAENKSNEISQFLDKFQKELSGLRNETPSRKQAAKRIINNKKNHFITSKNFKKLFPQAQVLFEFNKYGTAAREVLQEAVQGHEKSDPEFLKNAGFFKKQAAFNGFLLESYSDASFEGFKGIQLDFHY